MYCKKCGTQNPDGAKFCKNCGYELNAVEIEEEPPKKTVIEEDTYQNTTDTAPKKVIIEEDTYYNTTNTTAPKKTVIEEDTYQNTSSTTSSGKSDSSTWIGCCLCLIGIFIVFAILGL